MWVDTVRGLGGSAFAFMGWMECGWDLSLRGLLKKWLRLLNG